MERSAVLWVPNRGSPSLRFTLTQMWETADLSTTLRSVEMTKLGVVANQAFLNPIFIPLGGPQAHEYFGRDDKLYCLWFTLTVKRY